MLLIGRRHLKGGEIPDIRGGGLDAVLDAAEVGDHVPELTPCCFEVSAVRLGLGVLQCLMMGQQYTQEEVSAIYTDTRRARSRQVIRLA